MQNVQIPENTLTGEKCSLSLLRSIAGQQIREEFSFSKCEKTADDPQFSKRLNFSRFVKLNTPLPRRTMCWEPLQYINLMENQFSIRTSGP